MMPQARRPRTAPWIRVAAALVAGAPAVLWPLAALAQQFEKVEGKAAPEIPAGPFVAIAYGFIWVAILGYLVFVARGLARVRGDLAELRRKVDAATPPPAGR
jgi:CcmD family protein